MIAYVMRHAQTDTNKLGIMGNIEEDINEVGIKQCQEAAKKIKNMGFDLIISSPSPRTKHVTKIVNVNNLPVIYDNRLIERDLGIYEGCVYKDIDASDFWNYYSKKYTELESMQSVCKRIEDLIKFVEEKYSDKKILFITHAGAALGFYCNEHGIPENGDFSNFGHGNCEIKEYNVSCKREKLEEKIKELQGLFNKIYEAKKLEEEYEKYVCNTSKDTIAIGGVAK